MSRGSKKIHQWSATISNSEKGDAIFTKDVKLNATTRRGDRNDKSSMSSIGATAGAGNPAISDLGTV